MYNFHEEYLELFKSACANHRIDTDLYKQQLHSKSNLQKENVIRTGIGVCVNEH